VLLVAGMYGKINMRIVQVGANKGNTDNDPVWKLCQENLPESLDWYLYFVEPNPKAVEILRKSYENFNHIDILPYAVTDIPGLQNVQLFIDNDHLISSAGSQHCSLLKDHLTRHGHSDDVISSIQVLSFNLNDIFTLFGINNGIDDDLIDYLQIDTEGYDGKILLGANLSALNIKKIEFEHCHLDPEECRKVVEKLLNHSYQLVSRTHDDLVFERKINE
jgi:FkbM family methyltransferase